jgi:hypothetical protein
MDPSIVPDSGFIQLESARSAEKFQELGLAQIFTGVTRAPSVTRSPD